jgi:hypothetical protein
MHRRKTRIQVKGNPQYSLPANKHRFVNHPTNGTPKFCDFPAIKTSGKTFSAGPVYLREGQHYGANRGFGVQHIWREHFKEETDLKAAEDKIAALVAAILTPGAPIYYEGGVGAQGDRACVLRNQHGVVILEERLDGNRQTIYGVVTAIPRAQAHGTQIGTLPPLAQPAVAVSVESIEVTVVVAEEMATDERQRGS